MDYLKRNGIISEHSLEPLDSSTCEIENAWAQQIADRVAAFDRGEMPAYAADDVLAEARRLTP